MAKTVSVYVPYEKSITHHTTQTVHENRAPTDASVAILREMEQKTAEHLSHVFHCESNDVKFMFMQSQMSVENPMLVRWRIAYEVNGNMKTVESAVDVNANKSIEKAIDGFVRSIADSLYNAMFNGIKDGIINQLDKSIQAGGRQ